MIILNKLRVLCYGNSEQTSYVWRLLMMSCDDCGVWMHGNCVGLKQEDQVEDMDWFCPRCREATWLDRRKNTKTVLWKIDWNLTQHTDLSAVQVDLLLKNPNVFLNRSFGTCLENFIFNPGLKRGRIVTIWSHFNRFFLLRFGSYLHYVK